MKVVSTRTEVRDGREFTVKVLAPQSDDEVAEAVKEQATKKKRSYVPYKDREEKA